MELHAIFKKRTQAISFYTFRILNDTTINQKSYKITFLSCLTDRNMIGVFANNFLLVTIICSIPISSVHTVKSTEQDVP